MDKSDEGTICSECQTGPLPWSELEQHYFGGPMLCSTCMKLPLGKFTVHFDDEIGVAVPDGQARSWMIAQVNEKPEGTITIGTETMFAELRLLIAQKHIDGERVEFYFQGKLVPHNKGRIHRWPKGMANKVSDVSLALVKIGQAERKAKVNA